MFRFKIDDVKICFRIVGNSAKSMQTNPFPAGKDLVILKVKWKFLFINNSSLKGIF